MRDSKYGEEIIEKNSVKNKWDSRSLLKGILTTVLLVVCAALAAIYAYNHFMGESTGDYKSSVSKLQSKIVKANSDFAAVLNKDPKQFQSDAILKQIPKTIDSFNSITDSYNNLDSPSSYSASNKKLGDSISLNLSIYQSLQVILKNPIDTNAQNNLKQLSSLIDKCMDDYATVGIKGIDFTLPNEILSLTGKVGPWLSQKQSDNLRIMSLVNSYTKYFNSMTKLFEGYNSARIDFNTLIQSVRNNQSTWDKVFSSIDSSEKTLNDVKSSYASQDVPSALSSLNKRFGPVLDESILYLDKLRFAAQTEKSFSNSTLTQDQTTQINNLYQDAEKHNTNSFSNYQKFTSDMNSAKDNYLDPEYVSAHVTSK